MLGSLSQMYSSLSAYNVERKGSVVALECRLSSTSTSSKGSSSTACGKLSTIKASFDNRNESHKGGKGYACYCYH